jgi:hypothetical protein
MKKVTSFYLKFAGVGIALSGIAVARAGDSIDYIGPDSPSQAVTVNYSGHGKSLSVGTDAGFLQFKDVPQGNTFEAVCGDIFDEISVGSTYGDTLYTIPESSNLGYSPFTSDASINAAGYIVGNTFSKALAGTQGAGFGSANEQAAGLQIAVWAALYDSNVSGVGSQTAFNAMIGIGSGTAGDFTISGLSDSTTLADAYSDWLTKGTAPGGSDKTYLLEAAGANGSSGRGQDQFTEKSNYTPSGSPEPFTMGIGIAGVAFAVRRKVKRSK